MDGVSEQEERDANEPNDTGAEAPREKGAKAKEAEVPTTWSSAVARLVVGSLGTAAAIGVSWFVLIPRLYEWGFRAEPTVTSKVAAGLGIYLLAFIPLAGLSLVSEALKNLDNGANSEIERVEKEQEAIMARVSATSQSGDPMGTLLNIDRYSQIKLDVYYRVGLTQARWSFRWAVIAMWLGFTVIVAGLSVGFLPEKLGVPKPPDVLNYLVLAAGIVIEAISCLFLWIYRGSVKQMKYFYDRQVFTHGLITAFQVAGGSNASEVLKELLVSKAMEYRADLDFGPLPSGSQVVALQRKGNGAAGNQGP